jgi:glycosyltransferase involved in cell wall biosynthesis
MSSTAPIRAYDCGIATRNRINALRMSIPLILRQDVPPTRLNVVDASDDHESLRTEVGDIGDQLGFGNTVVVRSDRPNLTRQRNIGLPLVQASVVMFPDDDSMWYAGFASSVMKVYQFRYARTSRWRGRSRRNCFPPGIGAALIQEEQV